MNSLVNVNRRNLRISQLIAILSWCGLSICGSVWWEYRRAQNRELEVLYVLATSGNLANVKQISQYHSSQARRWLLRLAQNKGATTDSRVAALHELDQTYPLDSEALAVLLWIEQPFEVRHAAAEVFERRGCDSTCVSASLFALDALWKGEPTAETQTLAAHPNEMTGTIVSGLHQQSERDYLTLLNRNARVARRYLLDKYNSDAEFSRRVQAELGGS